LPSEPFVYSPPKNNLRSNLDGIDHRHFPAVMNRSSYFAAKRDEAFQALQGNKSLKAQ